MSTSKTDGKTEGTVVLSTRVFSDDDLRSLQSFQDVFNRATELGLGVADEPEIGTGFTMLDDKDKLVKVRFVIVEWRFLQSSEITLSDGSPSEYVAASLVTEHNQRYVITDGSAGIFQQLKRITQRRVERAQDGVSPYALLPVAGGLRKSEFFVNQETGEIRREGGAGFTKAATYYLAE